MPSIRFVLRIFMLFAVLPTIALASVTTGVIKGTTVDEGGLPIPGTTVTIVSDNMMGQKQVVTKIDGKPCRGGTQLVNTVAVRRPGTSIELEVNRFGDVLNLTVSLQERTDAAMALFKSGEIFGAKVVPVTPDSARQYGYRGLNSGLIVTEIEQGSMADQANLQVGDVIEGAAGIELVSVEQLREIIGQANQVGQPIRIVVRRGNSRMLLMLR